MYTGSSRSLVNNIVKYAESKNVTISIHADRHAMHMFIDDGRDSM